MNATEFKAGVRMHRIQRVSKILRAIMLALLIVYGAGIVAGVLMLPFAIFHRAILKSHTVFNNFGAFVFMPVVFMVALNFFRLFTRLKDGHLFEGQTITCLERAGKWWIVLGIAQMIFQSVDAYIFSPNKINISGDGIFCGLIIFFIAWLLREGQKLKEEQELTV